MSSFPLTNSYFSRWLLHHQPVMGSCWNWPPVSSLPCWLVVWNTFFPFSWECHHPNWLIFFRGVGRYTTNQSLPWRNWGLTLKKIRCWWDWDIYRDGIWNHRDIDGLNRSYPKFTNVANHLKIPHFYGWFFIIFHKKVNSKWRTFHCH